MKSRFALHRPDGSMQILELAGRAEWALSHLIAAGDAGCTPIDTPGPRWAHYIWLLRGRGVDVQTLHEAHGGPFAGTHARYRIRSRIERLTSVTPRRDDRFSSGVDHVG